MASAPQPLVEFRGVEKRYGGGTRPAVAGLASAGLARLDPLELGLDTAPGSDAVLDRGGEPVPGLHAIGPCAPGGLWEITAVAEIRRQVAGLAERLAPSPCSPPAA